MPTREVNFLTEEEVQEILHAPLQYEDNEIKRARDYAILNVLYST
jgi:site-specific recombinase XerD